MCALTIHLNCYDEKRFGDFFSSLLDLGDEARETVAKMDPSWLVRIASDPRERFHLSGGNSVAVLLERSTEQAQAIPAMIRLLKDGSDSSRSHAARVLGRWMTFEAVEPLAHTLHEDHRYLPTYAAVSLARLGDARGLGVILRLPRRTTPAQGRMHEALLALNGIRHPDAFRKAVSAKWSRESGWYWTLEDAVSELGRRTGMKCAFSREITDLDRRTPSDWARKEWSLDDIASTWGGVAAFVIEPSIIRVVKPQEAFQFWQLWAKKREE